MRLQGINHRQEMVQARWNSSIAQKINKHDNNLTKWCNLNWTDDPHINQIKRLFQVYEELGQMLSPALGELARGCYFEFSPSSYSNFVNAHLGTYQFLCSFSSFFQGEEDERTEILLAATFLLIVILAFIGWVPQLLVLSQIFLQRVLSAFFVFHAFCSEFVIYLLNS